MKTSVKISYTHPGTQPPVYIITSLSSPPWETIEMQLSEEKTEAGEFLFNKEFDDVEEGEYQYKFRLGLGDWWVLDETAETATDDAGNKNNVITVKVKPILEHATHEPASAEPPKETESTAASMSHHTDAVFEAMGAPQIRGVAVGDLKSQRMDEEEVPKDASTAKSLEAIPIPFTVVEKVPDVEEPQYGDVEADSLHEDAPKRAQDAQPDAEYVSPPEAPPKAQEATSPGFPSVPALVVEKINNEPSHGDDFGEEATSAQKLAHEIRAADAESPVASRACSSIEPGSPLNPIEENSGDEEEMDLPSPAVGYAKSAVTSAEIPEKRIDEVEDDVHNSDGSGDSKDFEASDPAGPVSRGPLTPPLTPKENKDRYREDRLDTPVAEASTPTKKRTLSIPEEATPKPIDEANEYLSAEEVSTPTAKGTEPPLESAEVPRSAESSRPSSSLADNRAATPNSVITPSQNKQEGFFRVFFQVVFGSWLTPLGRFFASLCGGKKNATGVVTVAVIAFTAYYLIGAS